MTLRFWTLMAMISLSWAAGALGSGFTTLNPKPETLEGFREEIAAVLGFKGAFGKGIAASGKKYTNSIVNGYHGKRFAFRSPFGVWGFGVALRRARVS